MQRVRLAFQAPAAGHALHVAILAGHMLAVIGSPLAGHCFCDSGQELFVHLPAATREPQLLQCVFFIGSSPC